MIKKATLFAIFVVACLSTYDATLGFDLCKLTVASYCHPIKVKDWSCGPCANSPIKLSNVDHFSNSTGDVLGIIGISQSPRAICLFLFIFRFGF